MVSCGPTKIMGNWLAIFELAWYVCNYVRLHASFPFVVKINANYSHLLKGIILNWIWIYCIFSFIALLAGTKKLKMHRYGRFSSNALKQNCLSFVGAIASLCASFFLCLSCTIPLIFGSCIYYLFFVYVLISHKTIFACAVYIINKS